MYLRGPCPPLAVLYTHVAISDYSSWVVWMVHVASWTWYTIMLWCYHVNSFCHGAMNYIAGIGSLLLLVEFELLFETLKKINKRKLDHLASKSLWQEISCIDMPMIFQKKNAEIRHSKTQCYCKIKKQNKTKQIKTLSNIFYCPV